MFEIGGDSTPVHKLSSLDTNSNLLIIKLKINSLEVAAVVDTGATVSFIPSDGIIMNLVQPTLVKTSMKVQAADNEFFSISRKTTLPIQLINISMNPIDTTVLIIPQRTDLLGYDLILGNPEIKSLKVDIINQDNKLLVKRGDIVVGQEESCQEHPTVAMCVPCIPEPNVVNTKHTSEHLEDMLTSFRDVFAERLSSQEHINCQPMRINLISDWKPRAKLKNHSTDDIMIIKDQVDRLQAAGIIEISYSEYASNVRVVPKKTGDKRLVINYIPLNRITCRDLFPLPRADDLFLSLHGANFFSALDCTEGFFQVPLAEEDRPKTAFITPHGLYQYTRCCFGLTNSPATYQRTMNTIFEEGLYKFCVIYVDDILVFGETVDQHNERLKWTLNLCQKYNIKLKRSKCKFLQTHVEFLGHLISPNKISPVRGKMDPIYGIVPKVKTEVQMIVGSLNYYARFIPGFAALTEPIRSLMKDNCNVIWGQDQINAMTTIRTHLENAESHTIPTLNQPKLVELITCNHTIEAICLTENRDLISRAGCVLTDSQINYTQVEKTLLATILAYKKFGIYLDHENTTLSTSCTIINKVLSLTEVPIRIQRLLLHIPHHLEAKFSIRNPETVSGISYDSNKPVEEIFYTDGACSGNGTKDCIAAWAVWSVFNKELTCSGIVVDDKPTNQVAELRAFIEAIRIAKLSKLCYIAIFTDSTYITNGFKKHLATWNDNKWIGSDKKPLINKTLWKELFECKTDMKIRCFHVKGHSNDVGNDAADSLARKTLENHIKRLGYARPIVVSEENWDEEIRELVDKSINNPNSPYIVSDNKLYYIDKSAQDDNRLRLYIPKQMRKKVLQLAHDDQLTGGHHGTKKTKQKLCHVYWPGMSLQVDDYVRSCDKCQRFKTPRGPKPGLLQPIQTTGIFERIHIDIVGPLTESSSGNKWIITAIEAFSRFGFANATREVKTDDVIRFINQEIISRHGAPRCIVSDNGPQFTSEKYTTLMRTLGIKVSYTCDYHPQANGMDEKFNGTLVKILKNYISANQKDWDIHLIWAVYNYNTTINASTNFSPYTILYGLEPRNPLKCLGDEDLNIDAPLLRDIRDAVRRKAKENIDLSQKVYKYYYDRKHKQQEFHVGQLVLIKSNAVPSTICRKLAFKWIGPYVVVKFIGDKYEPKALLVAELTSYTRKRVPFSSAKPYFLAETDPDEVDEETVKQIEVLEGRPDSDSHIRMSLDDFGHFMIGGLESEESSGMLKDNQTSSDPESLNEIEQNNDNNTQYNTIQFCTGNRDIASADVSANRCHNDSTDQSVEPPVQPCVPAHITSEICSYDNNNNDNTPSDPASIVAGHRTDHPGDSNAEERLTELRSTNINNNVANNTIGSRPTLNHLYLNSHERLTNRPPNRRWQSLFDMHKDTFALQANDNSNPSYSMTTPTMAAHPRVNNHNHSHDNSCQSNRITETEQVQTPVRLNELSIIADNENPLDILECSLTEHTPVATSTPHIPSLTRRTRVPRDLRIDLHATLPDPQASEENTISTSSEENLPNDGERIIANDLPNIDASPNSLDNILAEPITTLNVEQNPVITNPLNDLVQQPASNEVIPTSQRNVEHGPPSIANEIIMPELNQVPFDTSVDQPLHLVSVEANYDTDTLSEITMQTSETISNTTANSLRRAVEDLATNSANELHTPGSNRILLDTCEDQSPPYIPVEANPIINPSDDIPTQTTENTLYPVNELSQNPAENNSSSAAHEIQSPNLRSISIDYSNVSPIPVISVEAIPDIITAGRNSMQLTNATPKPTTSGDNVITTRPKREIRKPARYRD